MYQWPPINKENEKGIPIYPEFVRGTTPSFSYTLTDTAGDALDLSQFSTIKVTMAEAGTRYSNRRLTIENNDISVDGNVISFCLTEPQSSLFNVGLISLQVYGKSEETGSWATLAEDVTLRVRGSLKDGDNIENPQPMKADSTFKIGDQKVTGTLNVDHVTYANGTKNYENLQNKPALVYGTQRRELTGDISMADFGLREEALQGLTNTDIDNLIRGLF